MRMSKKYLQMKISELKKDLNDKMNEISLLKRHLQDRDELIADLSKKLSELNRARDDDKEEEMLMLDHVAKTIEEVIETLIDINDIYLMKG